jgi:hypothetical protein
MKHFFVTKVEEATETNMANIAIVNRSRLLFLDVIITL